jgi:protein-disulfide isomerase
MILFAFFKSTHYARKAVYLIIKQNMFNKIISKMTVFSLILSVIALILSGVSLSKAGAGLLDDKAFSARVEKGINDYIDKQRAAQEGGSADNGAPVAVSTDDDPVLGDKNAPVTIVEFSDFECPFCGRFHQSTLPQIVSEYIDKGKARLVYRDFPLSFHKDSRSSSLAANCAGEQGGDKVYFKFHDKLYENQTALGTESYKKWASELGLNAAKFSDCLAKEKYASEVDKDMQDATSYGVSGTPAFFINGRKITGAQPFSAFKTVIDDELAKAGK